MRVTKRIALPLLGSLLLMSACGGYGRSGVVVTAQLGPGIELYSYSAQQHGDWHANYREWTPAVVYEVNGQYYQSSVRGSRELEVYHSRAGGYFLPPQEQEWVRTDKRFHSKRRPNEADYGRVHSRP